MSRNKAVAIVSGGMDSAVLQAMLHFEGVEVHCVSFDYGQRHKKELEFAMNFSESLGHRHDLIDLTSLDGLITKSSLTSEQEVPDGHFADLTMKKTVVPNRNMMMLSIAASVAISEGASFVATAVHGGDHFIYPDCRPPFIDLMTDTLLAGNEGMFINDFGGVYAPFLNRDKAYIAYLGESLEVDWLTTWSCYKGGDIHCGRCGTCVERREAFQLAEIEDPTPYGDYDFAWEAIKRHKAESEAF